MKPLIFYVDDEPHNLVVFEAACPDDWIVRTFTSPMDALAKLDTEHPWVIVSDQRMPGMTGVQFLEIARKISPKAVRITVTGYSDEDLVVESVRKAAIFDYIKKPWEVDDLLASIGRAIELHVASSESARLQTELVQRESELRTSHDQLTHALRDVELAEHKEKALRQELECWVPPFVLWAIKDQGLGDMKRNVVGIAFDIIGSSELHDLKVGNRSVRAQIIQNFSECVLRHGGWRESHSGDSAYGHFGLSGNDSLIDSSAECALAAAREFRASLRSISNVIGRNVECGIALHIARECPIHVHTVHLNTPFGPVTQKSFDTSSTDVDLLHRIEKVVHRLPGTNIVMSKAFIDTLKSKPEKVVSIGSHLLQGQRQPVDLHVLPGDMVTDADLASIHPQSTSIRLSGPGAA